MDFRVNRQIEGRRLILYMGISYLPLFLTDT